MKKLIIIALILNACSYTDTSPTMAKCMEKASYATCNSILNR